MGLFDDVTCQYPLANPEDNARHFQTKSFSEPCMDQYEIRVDGTLWVQELDAEEHSRWVQVSAFTGAIDFYDYDDQQRIGYLAVYRKGVLQFIDPVPDEVQP